MKTDEIRSQLVIDSGVDFCKNPSEDALLDLCTFDSHCLSDGAMGVIYLSRILSVCSNEQRIIATALYGIMCLSGYFIRDEHSLEEENCCYNTLVESYMRQMGVMKK